MNRRTGVAQPPSRGQRLELLSAERYWIQRANLVAETAGLTLQVGDTGAGQKRSVVLEQCLSESVWSALRLEGVDEAATRVALLLGAIFARRGSLLGRIWFFGLEPTVGDALPLPVALGERTGEKFSDAFGRLRKEVERASRAGSSALRSSMDESQSLTPERRSVEAVVVRSAPVDASCGRSSPGFEQFDLCVDIDVLGRRLLLAGAWGSDGSATLEDLGEQLSCALEACVSDPEVDLQRFDLVGPGQRKRLLSTFNQTAAHLPEVTVLDEISGVGTRRPAAPAIRHRGHTTTYGELLEDVKRFATALRAEVEAGDVVAVALPRTPDLVVTILALWQLGCVYLPVDPRYPTSRIVEILNKSRARALIGRIATQTSVAEARVDAHFIDVEDLSSSRHIDGLERQGGGGMPTADAYTIFTSGSTGAPKGAIVRHDGMLNHMLAKIEDLELNEHSVVAQTATLTFDISIWQLFAALLVGGSTLIVEDDVILDPDQLWRLCSEEGVSVLELVPSYLTHALQSPEVEARRWPELKWLVSTGEAVGVPLIEQWFSKFPDTRVMNAYGPTEASDDIAHCILDTVPSGGRVPIGKPIRNARIYVLDDDDALVPVGVAGQLCVAGVCVGGGYLHDEEETRRAFTADPFEAGAASSRMYRTGDVARWLPDGQLEFLGRRDDQVKVRGFRIELDEIRTRLESLDGVVQGCVLAVEDDDAPELRAFVVASDPIPELATRLKARMEAQLPGYMVPSVIEVVDTLPVTSNGKVDKRALLAMARRPSVRTVGAPRVEGRAPDGAVASRMLSLFREVLGNDSIGVDDDFFQLGGNSLKAISIAAKFGPGLNALDILANPSVSALMPVVETGERPSGMLHVVADVDAPELHVVAIPNSGGGPFSYRAVGEALARLGSRVRLHVLEPPREVLDDDGQALRSLQLLRRRLADEIADTIDGPVYVFGQCNGAAVALALVEELEIRGFDLRGLGVGGLLGRLWLDRERDPFRRDRSDKEILSVLERMGATLPEEVDEVGLFLRDFRHDTGLANAYLNDSVRRRLGGTFQPVSVPITFVAGTNDPVAPTPRRNAFTWLLYGDDVRVQEISEAGHYLLRDAPEDVARILDATARGELIGVSAEISLGSRIIFNLAGGAPRWRRLTRLLLP